MTTTLQEHLAAAQKLIDNKDQIEKDLARLEVVEKELNKLNEERGEIRARLREVMPWINHRTKGNAHGYDEKLAARIKLLREKFGEASFKSTDIREVCKVSHAVAYGIIRKSLAMGTMRCVEESVGPLPSLYALNAEKKS